MRKMTHPYEAANLLSILNIRQKDILRNASDKSGSIGGYSYCTRCVQRRDCACFFEPIRSFNSYFAMNQIDAHAVFSFGRPGWGTAMVSVDPLSSTRSKLEKVCLAVLVPVAHHIGAKLRTPATFPTPEKPL